MMANNKFWQAGADTRKIRFYISSATHRRPGVRMRIKGVTFCSLLVLASAAFSGCSGGGGSSTPIQPTPSSTNTITASPSPTPTPVNSTPNPIVASWKGVGSYSAQSDPNWPLTFSPVPGDPIGAYTNGPPINFTSVGQSVTVFFSQVNYNGALPTSAVANGSCSGISGKAAGQNQYSITYASIGVNSCALQFGGQLSGSYRGAAVLIPIVVPASG